MIYQYTYFLDRALGKSVGEALQALGVKVEFHNDHFRPDSPDTEWLPIVSENGWVILTKDKMIGKNILEIKAMAVSNAKVFVLVSGNFNRQEMIKIFVNTIEKIDKFAQGNQAPFFAKIYKDSRVEMWLNKTALKKYLKNKPTA